MGVVEEWVEAYNRRDFPGIAACLSREDFERVGPYLDVIGDSTEYVSFLERVVPTMGDDYRLVIERVVYVPEEHVAYAQLVEHYTHDGEVRDTPELIVFGLGEDGLVHRMRLYLQRPGGQAPVGGRAAMGSTSS